MHILQPQQQIWEISQSPIQWVTSETKDKVFELMEPLSDQQIEKYQKKYPHITDVNILREIYHISLNLKSEKKLLKELLKDQEQQKIPDLFQSWDYMSWWVGKFLDDKIFELFENNVYFFVPTYFEEAKNQSDILAFMFRNKNEMTLEEYNDLKNNFLQAKRFFHNWEISITKKKQTIWAYLRDYSKKQEKSSLDETIYSLKSSIAEKEEKLANYNESWDKKSIWKIHDIEEKFHLWAIHVWKLIPKMLLHKIKWLPSYEWISEKKWNFELTRKIIFNFLSVYLDNHIHHPNEDFQAFMKVLLKNYHLGFVKEMFSLALAKNMIKHSEIGKRIFLENISLIDSEAFSSGLFIHKNFEGIIFEVEDFQLWNFAREEFIQKISWIENVYFSPNSALLFHDFLSHTNNIVSLQEYWIEWYQSRKVWNISKIWDEFCYISSTYFVIDWENKWWQLSYYIPDSYLEKASQREIYDFFEQPTSTYTPKDWHQYSQKPIFSEKNFKKIEEKRK